MIERRCSPTDFDLDYLVRHSAGQDFAVSAMKNSTTSNAR
jgi:hypothetical protein